MQFCSVCGSFCVNDHKKKVARCTRCNHTSERDTPNGILNKRLVDEKLVVVNDFTRLKNSFPRRTCLCPKCGYREAYVSIVGSNDETDFEVEKFSCALCGFSWRDNT